MLIYRRKVRIEWGDCDPAGIIFYPRYFAIFDSCTTAMIERALGMRKYDYLKEYEFAGHPLVETRAKFLQPTRFGDEVLVESTVREFRRSSFDIEHKLFREGALAVEAAETRVWVGPPSAVPGNFRAQPIPARVIERFKAETGAPA